jgi:trehalose 6-phosphate phosphatase
MERGARNIAWRGRRPFIVTTAPPGIHGLPNALHDQLAAKLSGVRLAIFLDYDGTLTPIVARPEDAVISPKMREVVRGLAGRCTVCVVSGRDRPVVQRLMGVDDLVVAGSHGFDIWSPTGGAIEREEGEAFSRLLEDVTERLRRQTEPVAGALIEPKKSSVAVHYRLVDETERPRIKALVDEILATEPDALKLTPGKMVYEIQPKIDWNKGKAVLYLLEALDLGDDDILPLYVGDDITDEDAFAALHGRGVGILVADPDDPELAGRDTQAEYVLRDTEEVARFLDMLGR